MKWDERKRNGTNRNEVRRMEMKESKWDEVGQKETMWDERKRCGTKGNDVVRMETMWDEWKRCGTNGNEVG
jgi:hypothetical protein